MRESKYLSEQEVNDLLTKEQKIARSETIAAYTDKAESLGNQLNSDVTLITFTRRDGSVAAAYFKEPNRLQRPDILSFLQNSMRGKAGALIYTVGLLKNDPFTKEPLSDTDILENDNCYDSIIGILAMDYLLKLEAPNQKKS